MARLRLAVVGVGHLGKEHARILAGLAEVELVGVADVNENQAQAVGRQVGCPAYSHHRPLLALAEAAVIAVPTTYHHAVAADFLRGRIPLLVEKPLAANLEQADNLVELARRHLTWLQVGHIERFNPALEALQRLPLQPKFVAAERIGPFSGRSTDIGVVLDLMIHDLDVLRTLVAAPLRSVEALGISVFGGHEDVANARLIFADGCVADLSASRAALTARRQMHVWAPEGYAGLDFAKRRLTLAQPSEPLRRQGLDPRRLDPASLARLKEELFGRYLHVLERDYSTTGDQLTRELQHFVHCVRTGTPPRVRGEDGRDAIALASRILDSIRHHPWEGRSGGPTGPSHLPLPRGFLIPPAAGGAAA